MSRPRFLADQDFNEHIIRGVLRREPVIDLVRLRDVGLERHPGAEILAYAAMAHSTGPSYGPISCTTSPPARVASAGKTALAW